VKAAVMAADVLMGNDEHAAAWIREHREPAPGGETGGRRINRRRAAVATGAPAGA
jgi:hypothetical protein